MEEIKTKDTSNERSGDMAEINAVLPAEQSGYFADTARKHWGPEAVGSKFKRSVPEGVPEEEVEEESGKTEDLLALLQTAREQRGSLEGDDRDVLIAHGVSPESLMPQCRYIMVETPGEIGIVQVKELPEDTPVRVVRKKQGVPCSLIVDGEEYPETNFGVVIIGPNEKQNEEDPEPTTAEMVWTAHPGLPIRPAQADIWEENSVITVADVKRELGEDAYVQFQGR